MAKALYETLGVEETATKAEIEAAFRRAAKECHPDLFPTPGPEQDEAKLRWAAVDEAKCILTDPTSRAAYDLTGIPHQMMSDEQILTLARQQVERQFSRLIQESIERTIQTATVIFTQMGPQQQIHNSPAPAVEDTDWMAEMHAWAAAANAEVVTVQKKLARAIKSCKTVRETLVHPDDKDFFRAYLDRQGLDLQGQVVKIQNEQRMVARYEQILKEYSFVEAAKTVRSKRLLTA